jgi:magnesium-transporting ATPase (P-type)
MNDEDTVIGLMRAGCFASPPAAISRRPDSILSITLSHRAKRMAKRGVIVRRLNAIENLGSMDVLCLDKTGTLLITNGALAKLLTVCTSARDGAGGRQPQPLDDALRQRIEGLFDAWSNTGFRVMSRRLSACRSPGS